MLDLKARWSALIDRCLAGNASESTTARGTTSTAPSDSVPVQDTADVPDDVVDKLPVHTAPAAQIDYWHAFGSNGFLQTLLREYALDFAPANVHAYNHFKIGLNEARHEATFAIDDTHYLAIPFNATNTAPMDRQRSRRVLERVNQLREERRRFEKFCDVMIERFDKAN